jgi:endonuclease/exonuclease/phosphatase family metal-dependent hydrolase
MPRILTYNVHRCLGTDGRLSTQRIADVIASCQPDIVALQELDVGRRRTGGIDQVAEIARVLDMKMHFHPVLQVKQELYGDAILTIRPSRLMRAERLPGLKGLPRLERRGALWVSTHIGGVDVQIINTHLGLLRRERLTQVDTLLGPHWLSHPQCRDPVILVGDFNAVPRSRAYRRLVMRMTDAQRALRGAIPRPTYPARMPVLRIDHVFVSHSIEIERAETLRIGDARVASDHLPLLVEFRVVPPMTRPTRAARSMAHATA